MHSAILWRGQVAHFLANLGCVRYDLIEVCALHLSGLVRSGERVSTFASLRPGILPLPKLRKVVLEQPVDVDVAADDLARSDSLGRSERRMMSSYSRIKL